MALLVVLPARLMSAEMTPTCVELFAGCGGLALGTARAGFRHVLVAEVDIHARATLAENKRRAVEGMDRWPLHEGDVREIDYAALAGRVDLVAGGPPCQPFSIGGRHAGPEDGRNMWPEALRAVRDLRPKAFMFENVRGLLRPAFADYLRYLELRLRWPELEASVAGDWRMQLPFFERHAAAGGPPTYQVVIGGINAADHGAPQKRHRAMVLGVRADLAPTITLPPPTHSRASLLWDQHMTGVYWERHGISRPSATFTPADEAIMRALRAADSPPSTLPWRTVRDTIGDLDTPRTDREPMDGHLLHPGARVYPRHTGSVWDDAAKALKAGAHGVPGGENILVPGDGSVRYFTLREMMRLQGLPDAFTIPGGGWKYPIRQLGNAVPVAVGEAFAGALHPLIAPPLARAA